jgi:hypothetical protein
MKNTTLIPVLVVILAAPLFCLATSVSGSFKADKKGEIKPTAVAAFPVRAQDDPHNKVTAVVLAEGTMDAASALQTLDPHTALINQEGMRDKNYITFVVRPDGFVGMNATFSDGMVQYIDSTKGDKESITAQALIAEFTENSPDRIAGRIHTDKPVKTQNGESYSLDVQFDTAITHAPAARDLGASGGEAGKALEALLAAIKSKDWKGVQQGIKSSDLESWTYEDDSDEENFDSVVGNITIFLPKGKSKVTGGEQVGDKVILELEGEMMEGDSETKALYLIQMVKEGQSWRFDRARLAGFL